MCPLSAVAQFFLWVARAPECYWSMCADEGDVFVTVWGQELSEVSAWTEDHCSDTRAQACMLQKKWQLFVRLCTNEHSEAASTFSFWCLCLLCFITSKQLLHCFPVFSNVDGSNDEKHSPDNPDHGAEQQAVLQTVKVPVGATWVYSIRDLHQHRYEIGVSDQWQNQRWSPEAYFLTTPNK